MICAFNYLILFFAFIQFCQYRLHTSALKQYIVGGLKDFNLFIWMLHILRHGGFSLQFNSYQFSMSLKLNNLLAYCSLLLLILLHNPISRTGEWSLVTASHCNSTVWVAEWRQQDSHYTVHIPGGLHKIIISPTLDTHAEHNPTRTNHDKYSSLLLPLCISFVAWKYTISLLVVIESLSPVIMTVIIAEMMTF